MSNYLMRYKGKYRLKAHVDKSTNDFPRNEQGVIESDDVYIKCAYGSQIYHCGYSTLAAYIPSIGRGRNVLRALGEELLGIKKDDKTPIEDLYKKLQEDGRIRSIVENDKELEFHFHSRNIELVAKYLKPSTAGANISPFSTKNLPKSDYTIPVKDLEEYQKIIANVPKEDILIISQITKRFIFNVLQKSKEYKSKNIKADMKLKKLKGKEYIHSIDKWNEYLKYLSKKIKEELHEKNK